MKYEADSIEAAPEPKDAREAVKAGASLKETAENSANFEDFCSPNSTARERDAPLICARPLAALLRPVVGDRSELIRHRFLCRKGGALLIGPTGVGKSSLLMQIMVSF